MQSKDFVGNFAIAQDICYTGLAGRNSFVQLGCLQINGTVCECRLHKNSLKIHFPTTRTSVTQKNCFRTICVIISGLMVFGEFMKIRKAQNSCPQNLVRHRKGPKMRKNCTTAVQNPQVSRGGGGCENLMDKRFCGHPAVSDKIL